MLIEPGYGMEQHPQVLTELSAIFSSFMPKEHRFRPAQPYADEYTWAIQQLAPVGVPPPGGGECHLLEVGGGVGAVQWYLAARGVSVVNVSLRQGQAPRTHAGRPSLPPVTFVPGDALDAQLPPRPWAAALGLSSIEHNYPGKITLILTRLSTLLPRGAPIVLTVPVVEVGGWFPRNTHPELSRHGDTTFFDPELARTVLGGVCGLEVLTDLPGPAEWRKRIRAAFTKVRRVKGAMHLPYLSGGLFLRVK